MIRELLLRSDLLDLPLVTMLFFVIVFTAVLFRALSPRRRAAYDAMAKLPLDEGSDPRVTP